MVRVSHWPESSLDEISEQGKSKLSMDFVIMDGSEVNFWLIMMDQDQNLYIM